MGLSPNARPPLPWFLSACQILGFINVASPSPNYRFGSLKFLFSLRIFKYEKNGLQSQPKINIFFHKLKLPSQIIVKLWGALGHTTGTLPRSNHLRRWCRGGGTPPATIGRRASRRAAAALPQVRPRSPGTARQPMP